ncbi:hypothetical protein BJX61DRAFT_546799 [Aspergillus egyptiacus]|nr:hypothetical protein BJX61DRAFT_546799 [Aspergillus egyptiacus]
MTSDRSHHGTTQRLATAETLNPLDNPEAALETFASMTYADPFDVHHHVLQISPGLDGPIELAPSVDDVSYSSEHYDRSPQLSPPEQGTTVHPPDLDYRFTSMTPPVRCNSQSQALTIQRASDTYLSELSTCFLNPHDDDLIPVETSLDQIIRPLSPLYPPAQSYDQTVTLHSHHKCHADNVPYPLSSGNGAPFQEEPTVGHSGASPSARAHTCKCIQRVLFLHEEVESRKAASLGSADYLLALQRTVLNDCTAIVGCERYRNKSAISMLLITICEKLHRSLQSLFHLCLDTIRSHKRSSPGLNHRKRGSSIQGSDAIHTVSFGRYMVESSQEQAVILIRLVEIQLRGLRKPLVQLKDTARYHSWKAHSSRVQEIERDTRRSLTELLRVTNDAFDQF